MLSQSFQALPRHLHTMGLNQWVETPASGQPWSCLDLCLTGCPTAPSTAEAELLDPELNASSSNVPEWADMGLVQWEHRLGCQVASGAPGLEVLTCSAAPGLAGHQ